MDLNKEMKKFRKFKEKLQNIEKLYDSKRRLLEINREFKSLLRNTISREDRKGLIEDMIGKDKIKELRKHRKEDNSLSKEINEFQGELRTSASLIKSQIANNEILIEKLEKQRYKNISTIQKLKDETSELKNIINSDYNRILFSIRASKDQISERRKTSDINEKRTEIQLKTEEITIKRNLLSQKRFAKSQIGQVQQIFRRKKISINNLICKLSAQLIDTSVNIPNINQLSENQVKELILNDLGKKLKTFNDLEAGLKTKKTNDLIGKFLNFENEKLTTKLRNLVFQVITNLPEQIKKFLDSKRFNQKVFTTHYLEEFMNHLLHKTAMSNYQTKIKENFALYNELTNEISRLSLEHSEIRLKNITDEIKTLNDEIKHLNGEVNNILDDIYIETGYDIAQDLEISKQYPILMFPVRLETKFVNDELWIRVYPDKLVINSHEQKLTEGEYNDGKLFFEDIWWAAYQRPEEDLERIKLALKQLADKYGTGRAIWIAKTLKGDDIANLIQNWQDRPVNPFDVDDYGAPLIDNGTPEPIGPTFAEDFITDFKSESWTEAPKVDVMPNYFVFDFYRKNEQNENIRVLQRIGNPIETPLLIFPDPNLDETEESSDEIFFDENSRWMINFDEAVAKGMGLVVTKAMDPEMSKGYSRILVYGVRISDDNLTSKSLIKDLFECSQYTNGFQFIKNGTPTNNVAGIESGFSSEVNKDDLFEVVFGDPFIGDEGDTGKDGYILARALGLENNSFAHVINANKTETLHIRHMMNVLWPSTMGYYLQNILRKKNFFFLENPHVPEFREGEDVSLSIREGAKKHTINFVNPRGALSGVQIGEIPYGILPVSSLDSWQPSILDAYWSDIEWDGTTTPSKIIFFDDLFNIFLDKILKRLKPVWLAASDDVDKVPRVGATDDPDAELLKILGMEPSSRSLQLIPKIDFAYLWSLITISELLHPGIFEAFESLGFNAGPSSNPSDFGYEYWWLWFSIYEYTPARQMFVDLHDQDPLIPDLDPLIVGLTSWSQGFDILAATDELNFIHDQPIDEKIFLNFTSSLDNYIDFIKNNEAHGLSLTNEHPSDSLLYNLLLMSKLIQTYDTDSPSSEALQTHLPDAPSIITFQDSLEYLRSLSVAELERLLGEGLDSFSHRLDAFISSIYSKRLWNMRLLNQNEPLGLYIGAFGWIEDLQPKEESDPQGGYIIAPSYNQAVTAAIARNSFLTYRQPDDIEVMTLKLSSDRVHRALSILDGIGQDQGLDVLLGYQFEKGLHENHTGLELDKYVYPFRRLYPIEKTIEAEEEDLEEDETSAQEVIPPQNVVDGLKLLTAWINTKSNSLGKIPFGDFENLPSRGNDYDAIIKELNCLDDALDALQDIGIFENIYHTLHGNYERAPVILDIIAGRGGNVPEIESLKTPGGGLTYTQNITIMFQNDIQLNPDEWLIDTANCSPRDSIEPRVRALVKQLLGNPSQIKWRIKKKYDDSPGSSKYISLQDLCQKQKFGPLDFILMSLGSPLEKNSSLERRIVLYALEEFNIENRSDLEIEFLPVEGWNSDDRTIIEVLPLARKIQELLSSSFILDPSRLVISEEAFEDPSIYFTQEDIDELNARITPQLTAMEAIQTKLNNLDRASVSFLDDVKNDLLSASLFGIPDSVPNVKSGEDDEAYKNLLDQQKINVLDIISQRLNKFTKEYKIFNELDISQPEKTKEAIHQLIICGKQLFGKSLMILPDFSVSENINELYEQFSSPQDKILGPNNLEYPYLWVQQTGYTRPKTKRLADIILSVQTVMGPDILNLQVLQFSNTPDIKWLALPNALDGVDDVVQDTLAMLVHSVGDPNFVDNRFCGLIIDEWVETIKRKNVRGAIAYNYNRPNTEPPQTMLLLIPSTIDFNDHLQKIEDNWTFVDISNILNDTLDLVKIRAVDIDAFTSIMRKYLPGIFVPHKIDIPEGG